MNKASCAWLAFVLMGCGQPPAVTEMSLESDSWTVTAHAPTLADGGVKGSMTFARSGGASTRSGGVCLVADLNGSAPCTTAEECASLPLPAGGYHYCAGINGAAKKTCWTRPGEGTAYCNRASSREPGSFETPAVAPLVEGKPTTWMSYACLANEANPGGCGTADPSQYVVATSPTLTTK